MIDSSLSEMAARRYLNALLRYHLKGVCLKPYRRFFLETVVMPFPKHGKAHTLIEHVIFEIHKHCQEVFEASHPNTLVASMSLFLADYSAHISKTRSISMQQRLIKALGAWITEVSHGLEFGLLPSKEEGILFDLLAHMQWEMQALRIFLNTKAPFVNAI